MFHRPPQIFIYNQARSTALSSILLLAFFIVPNVILLVLAVVSFLPAPSQRRSLDGISNFPSLAMASLGLNIYVTLCTEVVGLVHGTTLRWSLARSRRLKFCSNLRLFTAANRKWSFSNSLFLNSVMAILLVLSYTASSLCFLGDISERSSSLPSSMFSSKELDDADFRGLGLPLRGNFAGAFVYGIPVLILGFSLLGQSVIASWGYFEVNVPTWSPNPVDIASAAAAKLERHLKRRTGRCLRTASEADDESLGALQPRRIQPTLWISRSDVRKAVLGIWMLPFLAIVGFGIVYGFTVRGIPGTIYGSNWWLLPELSQDNINRRSPGLSIPWRFRPEDDTSVHPVSWVWTVLMIAAAQTALTLTLHCCELVVLSHRDEVTWRRATTTKGLSAETAFSSLLRSWPSLLLIVSKCILHWIFGLCFGAYGNIGMIIRPAQLLYLSMSTIILATLVTLLAHKRSTGQQPSTYGHIQALIDAVDVYSESTIWWGHKSTPEDTEICHAGTDVHKLGELDAKSQYM